MQRTLLTTDARSPASLWSGAPPFAATVLGDDPHAGVLIHCQQGRRESVMLAYAILRLRGRGAQQAAHRIRTPPAESRSRTGLSRQCRAVASPVHPLTSADQIAAPQSGPSGIVAARSVA